MGMHQDQRRTNGFRARGSQRGVDRDEIVAVRHRHGVPAIGRETLRAIFGKSDVGAGGQGDVVVVVEAGELAELEMPCQRGRFGGHALHQIAIADEGIGMVIDERVTGPVVAGRELRLCDRHADRVG